MLPSMPNLWILKCPVEGRNTLSQFGSLAALQEWGSRRLNRNEKASWHLPASRHHPDKMWPEARATLWLPWLKGIPNSGMEGCIPGDRHSPSSCLPAAHLPSTVREKFPRKWENGTNRRLLQSFLFPSGFCCQSADKSGVICGGVFCTD